MAEQLRYHINDKGNPGICRAKKKCCFGDIDSEHYATPDEARFAYEKKQEEKHRQLEKERRAARKNPMGVLPKVHRNIHEDSDAFYRTTPEQDDVALTHLAEYYYNREMHKISGDPDDELAMVAAKAKLLNSRVGAGYTGWQYDPMYLLQGKTEEEIESMETFIPPPPASSSIPEELPSEGSVRLAKQELSRANEVATYANDSREFLTNLTAREHNALAYWTGCGSTVANSAIRGFSNPWGIQSDDPDDEDYFDAQEYLRNVDAAIEKAPVTPERILYKGISKEIVGGEVSGEYYSDGEGRPKTLEWARSRYPVGEEISFDVPESTSLSSSVATSFSQSGVVLEIKASKAAPVGALSAWGLSEMEYLAPRTTKYRVVGFQERQTFSKAGRGGEPFEQSMFVVQLEQILE